MAKRPSKHLRPPRPLLSAFAHAEDKTDGTWMTQTMPGAQAQKAYVCPGCGQRIPPGTPHVVVWPYAPVGLLPTGVDERRHWHTSCWNRKR